MGVPFQKVFTEVGRVEVWAAPVWQEKEKANWAPAFGYYCFLFAHSVWATSPLPNPHAFLAMIDCPLMPTAKKKPSFKKAFIILWEPYTTYFDHIPSPPLTPSTLLSKVAFINKVTGTKDKMTRRELCIRGLAPEECWTLLFLSILRKLQSM